MSETLYSNEVMEVSLSDHPSAQGHVLVSPVAEKSKLSDLNEEEIRNLFFGASFSATALFELIGAQGTNIYLNEDESKLKINVIARKENDGINMQWAPKEVAQTDLDSVAKSIKDNVDKILWELQNPEEAAKLNKPKEVKTSSEEIEDSEENKSLLRIFKRRP